MESPILFRAKCMKSLFPRRESDFHIFASAVPVLRGDLGAHDNENVHLHTFVEVRRNRVLGEGS